MILKHAISSVSDSPVPADDPAVDTAPPPTGTDAEDEDDGGGGVTAAKTPVPADDPAGAPSEITGSADASPPQQVCVLDDVSGQSGQSRRRVRAGVRGADVSGIGRSRSLRGQTVPATGGPSCALRRPARGSVDVSSAGGQCAAMSQFRRPSLLLLRPPPLRLFVLTCKFCFFISRFAFLYCVWSFYDMF